MPVRQVMPLSSSACATPSRSMISSVRLDQQMARVPSERLLFLSMTTLRWPRLARSSAAASPTGPAPTITTGWCAGCGRSWSAERVWANVMCRTSVMAWDSRDRILPTLPALASETQSLREQGTALRPGRHAKACLRHDGTPLNTRTFFEIEKRVVWRVSR